MIKNSVFRSDNQNYLKITYTSQRIGRNPTNSATTRDVFLHFMGGLPPQNKRSRKNSFKKKMLEIHLPKNPPWKTFISTIFFPNLPTCQTPFQPTPPLPWLVNLQKNPWPFWDSRGMDFCVSGLGSRLSLCVSDLVSVCGKPFVSETVENILPVKKAHHFAATNSKSSENGWLEDDIVSFRGLAYFQGFFMFFLLVSQGVYPSAIRFFWRVLTWVKFIPNCRHQVCYNLKIWSVHEKDTHVHKRCDLNSLNPNHGDRKPPKVNLEILPNRVYIPCKQSYIWLAENNHKKNIYLCQQVVYATSTLNDSLLPQL